MDKEEQKNHDIIDEDLFEEIDEEEMYELIQESRRNMLLKSEEEKLNPKSKRRFPKWAFWLIAIAMLFNVISLLPQTFSIPAIDFLITSTKLSKQPDIKTYKEAVVVIEATNSRGTGFSVTSDGMILTNNHVVEGEDTVTIAFPDNGLFTGTVVERFPSIDIAVVQVEGKDLPYLTLADQTNFEENDPINFIGNPLKFQGIANEGTIIDYIQLNDWNEEVIMIKAPVYRGNSGSPIIDRNGEVIGIIFATLNHDEHGRVGLFVPIDYFHNRSK